MSVRTMARVWEFSRNKGNDLLMLLAIADFADDDGRAYPSVSTLAKKCRMKPRNASSILSALRASGELVVRMNEGPRGANMYRIILQATPLQESAGVQKRAGVQESAGSPAETCVKPLQKRAPKPSVNQERGAAHSPEGSRLPLDWSLPCEFREWSSQNLGWTSSQADDVAERFADYWRAVPGKNAIKADWFATWRNWCRREKPNSGKPSGNSGGSIFAGAL